ncbi:MAG: helix-turn-helix transcriptional regulator [bacterium]
MRYPSRVEKSIYSQDYRATLAWLRKRREENGLTMREVGERLGVHHSWVGRIEQGDRRLDMAEFVMLCKVIGCNPYDGLAFLAKESSRQSFLKAADNRPTWPMSK